MPSPSSSEASFILVGGSGAESQVQAHETLIDSVELSSHVSVIYECTLRVARNSFLS